MINFEKKIEEDFEELKKILIERYPNNLMEKKVIDLLKRVHKSIWALQVSSSSFFENIDSIDTPAEYTSKNVVVTVESTTIKSPIMPSPAFSKILAISDSIVNKAALIPIMYIQILTKP